MGKIDETKWILVIFLLVCIIGSILPLALAYELMCLNDYDSFYGLLELTYLDDSLLARVVLSNLNYASFQWIRFIKSIFENLSFTNLLVIITSIYLYCAKDEIFMKHYKKGCMSIGAIYIGMHILCVLVFAFGFKVTSLDSIIVLFKLCGMILCVGYLIIIFMGLMIFFYHMYHVRQTKRLFD